MTFAIQEQQREAERLFSVLHKTNWTKDECDMLSPLTLQIQKLKKEKNAIILSHSYQTPDIMYGIADVVGDSYGLAKEAQRSTADTIVFCSVFFMGETAKLLNPNKTVLVPSRSGCSLAESITADDVKNLKKQYPGRPVVCYVNTSAAVKAESDISCTSGNALRVIESFPDDEIIFIPDMLMGKNLQKLTTKKLILWRGTCIVHEQFTKERVDAIRQQYPGVKILAHTECSAGVVDSVDLAGSTNDMLTFVKQTDATTLMLATECGLTDRVKTEYPEKNIVGVCSLCPYMKSIMLRDVLSALKNPSEEQVVSIPEAIFERARQSLEKMMTL